MNRFLKWISYLIFWIVLSGERAMLKILNGSLGSVTVLIITEKTFQKTKVEHVKGQPFWRLLWLFFIVVVEMFKAAFQHIVRIIVGDDVPVILDIELSISDEFIVTLIANAITLTPGTITLKTNGNIITVLGFAKDEFEENEIRHTILTKFQKPFRRSRL